ncbi:MAG: hypothetical protein PVJ41_12675, partial [Desulfobacterales bacterium]
KPNYRKIVLCHLGCGNSSNIFQKRLPGVVGAEVSPGSLTRLFPTPLSAANKYIAFANSSRLY